jgi:hypothetical protein
LGARSRRFESGRPDSFGSPLVLSDLSGHAGLNTGGLREPRHRRRRDADPDARGDKRDGKEQCQPLAAGQDLLHEHECRDDGHPEDAHRSECEEDEHEAAAAADAIRAVRRSHPDRPPHSRTPAAEDEVEG